MKVEYVYWAVQTGSMNIIQVNINLEKGSSDEILAFRIRSVELLVLQLCGAASLDLYQVFRVIVFFWFSMDIRIFKMTDVVHQSRSDAAP